MLRDNFRDQLGFLLDSTNEFIIKINDSTWDISINWQVGLEDKFTTLPTWYEMSNKSRLYTQFQRSIESAKFNWIYDKIFKYIKQ